MLKWINSEKYIQLGKEKKSAKLSREKAQYTKIAQFINVMQKNKQELKALNEYIKCVLLQKFPYIKVILKTHENYAT